MNYFLLFFVILATLATLSTSSSVVATSCKLNDINVDDMCYTSYATVTPNLEKYIGNVYYVLALANDHNFYISNVNHISSGFKKLVKDKCYASSVINTIENSYAETNVGVFHFDTVFPGYLVSSTLRYRLFKRVVPLNNKRFIEIP